MFVLDKPLQPSLMFVGKAGAYPGVEQFKCTSLGLAPGLSCKYWMWLERPVREKLSSLLQKIVNYSCKKFHASNTWFMLSGGRNLKTSSPASRKVLNKKMNRQN